MESLDTYRLGYVANCLSLGIGASHTCRLAGATPERLSSLIAQNLEELEQILLFNEAHGIHVYRIGSSLVPFASHPVNTLPWWRTFRSTFERIGRIARRSSQRLSLHPSPAGASLSSQHERVRKAALVELGYGARVLDLLDQGPEARVVLHVGGAAPERPVALENAHRMLDTMPAELRDRLVVEHDDKVWSAREVLPLAREHGVPFLADNLHNDILPSEPELPLRELLRASAETWTRLGLRPKFHLASQRPGGRPGHHADQVSEEDFRAVLAALPGPADLMLEAKEKDLALFALRGEAPPRAAAGTEAAAEQGVSA
ncbi:UV DNA damage repair endonuclease UvsE [Aggregicoccus sp. 17bor-14]|uniref:UV DNA damage repair endonuclease UvsE n=1 Tax=Myxococcaceae TaxID=31 RepID=UPI00129CF0C3|nr:MULTISPECIES: UV DNA damage repair endonuclease UvsE [Myxococcaceae]MBF5040781.1 UV DNA damage repair endonuclease UvsE [Simulacricoccus sp. 17bor-14]MRI86569.1 UV DNA damage repair endonuclease UvsE [Aggregicoccus sp. 17bor-14]